MRVVIMFDLPVLTKNDRREYSKFRKYLMKNGFIMMQESVYCKLVQNATIANYVIEAVRKNKPPKGLVQALSITEKQYAKMDFIVGESKSDILDTDERVVII